MRNTLFSAGIFVRLFKHHVESYLKFLLFLIELFFFWYDCYRRCDRERKHSWDFKSFILGDTIQLLTPLVCLVKFEELFQSRLWGRGPHTESPNFYISLEQSYNFRKLFLCRIWLVKPNVQVPPLTIPLPIKNLLTEHPKVNNLFIPVNLLSQAYIRSWLVYSKCQQYKWA